MLVFRIGRSNHLWVVVKIHSEIGFTTASSYSISIVNANKKWSFWTKVDVDYQHLYVRVKIDCDIFEILYVTFSD